MFVIWHVWGFAALLVRAAVIDRCSDGNGRYCDSASAVCFDFGGSIGKACRCLPGFTADPADELHCVSTTASDAPSLAPTTAPKPALDSHHCDLTADET